MQLEPSSPGGPTPHPSPSTRPLSWTALTDTLDVGVLGTDPRGTVVLANRAATALLGREPLGRGLLDVLADVEPLLSATDLARAARDRVPLQRSVQVPRGRATVRHDVRVVAMAEGGVVTGYAVQVLAGADTGSGSGHGVGPHRDDAVDPAGDLTVGRVSVDLATRVLRVEGRAGVVRLTGREFELLCELMRQPGRLRSRASLLHSVWRIDFPTSTSVVDVTMSRLRAKTGLTELSTHRSDGYAFDVANTGPHEFGPTVVAPPTDAVSDPEGGARRARRG